MDNKENQIQETNPLENANIFSILTFAWLYKIFRSGYKRDLGTNDLYSCLKEDSSQILGNSISKFWNTEKEKFKGEKIQGPSLIRVLVNCFGKQFIFIGLWQGVGNLFEILQVVQFIKVLSYFNGKKNMPTIEAYWWASGFAISLIVCFSIDKYCLQAMNQIDMKFRVSCSALIYRKCLRLSKASIKNSEATVGQIINVLNNDISNINCCFLHYVWIAPIQATIVSVILYQEMNIFSFMGTLIIYLLISLQGYFGKWIKNLTHKVALRTDKRLSLLNEIIGGVKVIKMYAWEKPFSRLVDKARAKELSTIRKICFIDTLILSLDSYIPRLSVFVIIFFYILFENNISAEQVYMVTAFYNVLRGSVNVRMTLGTQLISKMLVCVKRIEELMILDEIEPSIPKNLGNQDSKIAVKIDKASAKWSPHEKKDTLNNINFVAERGSLSAIIGQVGSGKSSLLHILLNELPLSSGTIQLSGKIVYVSQEPWVFASSIRQNIIFGLPMDKKHYEKVVKVCQLEQDFALFSFGDKTLIGEKGMTLSGGQKARINLARAVYSDADIYLLDDPLSAVDSNIGRKIFQDCVCEFLKGKTRILVTHQLQYLKSVDRIFVLNNKSVEKEGSFNDLQALGLDLLKILPVTKDDDDEVKSDAIGKEELALIIRNSEEEIPEEIPEHRIVGKTSGRVYLFYLKAAGNIWILILALFLGIFYQVIATCGDFFLAQWVNRVEKGTNETLSAIYINNMWYLQVYSLLTLGAVVLTTAFFLIVCEICMRSSQNLHSLMFYSLMRTTMSFFHENASGRILNRFSKDIGAVDKEMLKVLEDIAQCGLLLVAIVVINTSVNPWLLIPTLIVGSVFYLLRIIYMKTSRSLKRLEAINRSPIFSHVSTTLQGLTTIRAFKAEEKLTEEFHNHQNLHSSAWYAFSSCGTAFSFYLQLICSLYIALVVYTFVSIRNNVSVGDAGLVITQCILLANMVQWGMRQTTEMETLMTCVERIMEYSDLDQEPSLETKTENKPPVEWPSEGRVEFKDVCLSYHPSGVEVLKDINFVVFPKQKIGIVGRTGAGKSSLTAALFRLAYLKGEIYIDDLATSNLDLYDVRSNISIIPQEPLLFAGSLRRNLDLFENYSDDELWQALAEVELKEFIKDFNAGLNIKVFDGGSNFSVGQRQLLCLARAIIRNKKILVLDEATANVDLKTDELIQKTIRRRLKDCTVFIIAHRLNTVMDCDKIIVMDSGYMVEFDHPYELLEKQGYLHKMVLQTGTDMAKVLTKIAENSYYCHRHQDKMDSSLI